MTKSQVANLGFVNNSVYVKTFSTFDKKVIDNCHYYMGDISIPLLYDLKRCNLYQNLHGNNTSPAGLLFCWIGQDDLGKICLKYDIRINMSRQSVKYAFWKWFKTSLA